VVITSVPDNCIAVGIPARFIAKKIEGGYSEDER